MSWADDFLKQQQGAQQAQTAEGSSSWTGGFFNSALSAIPELFGEKPSQPAVDFRTTHPYAGIASQLVGGLVPYAGAGVLSETAVGAKILDQALETIPGVKTLSAVDNPFLHRVAKEAIRYSPVEIARLGVGLGTTDSWHDYGNLLADVGLSTLITGGFGGIGGFFRVGGKVTRDIGGVEGAPLGLRPTFELRMSRTPGATPAEKGSAMADVQNDLQRQVFTETPYKSTLPGQKDAYVQGLEGGTPETDTLMNALFKPAMGKQASVLRQPLMDRAGIPTLDDGAMKQLLSGLEQKSGGAIKSMDDIAEHMVFPRLVTVNSSRAAGTVSKALDDSAMQWVSPGVMAGKEAEGGLHVMAVRLKAGEAPTAALKPSDPGLYANNERIIGDLQKTVGQIDTVTKGKTPTDLVRPPWGDAGMQPVSGLQDLRTRNLADIDRITAENEALLKPDEANPKITQGDQWMLFKTDRPQVFAPEGYKLAQRTVESWSKFRNAWRVSGVDDFANKSIDNYVQNFTPTDFKEAVTLPKSTALSNITRRLAGKFAETTGLKDSSTLRAMANTFMDVVAPTVVNERSDALFGRLFGGLRWAHKSGEEIVNSMVGGGVHLKPTKMGMWTRANLEHAEGLVPGEETIVSAISRLSDEDRLNYWHIQNAQAPADELEKYTADGLVSDDLRKAVELVQKSDRYLWENHLGPAFANSSIEGKFNLLEGYIGPRLFHGDYRAAVVDEYGNLKWLASGTRSQAQHEAKAVAEEANKRGLKLVANDPYMIGTQAEPDQVKNLHDLVQMQIGKSGNLQDSVQAALRRMAIDQKGRKPTGTLPRAGPPKGLLEERTGVQGTPDKPDFVPTAQDIIKGVDNHYKQLMRFAATKVWEDRFQQEAHLLSNRNSRLYNDLVRKKNQMMGYEGQITRVINTTLDQTILGHMAGSKSGTKIATATNGLLYDWNLAIVNPTFSVLNVLQPIQTVLPHLSFLLSSLKHGFSEEIEKDMQMSLRYGADGKPREVIGVLDPAKILYWAVANMGKPEGELAELLGRMKTRGTLGAQLFEGFIGGQSEGLTTIRQAYKNAGGGAAGSWEAMKRIATFTATRSEELSRAIAALSYYRLGKEYIGLEGERLLQFMEKGTHNSMFGYSLMDRSRMFTGPIGSMFGLFKNWQMHFISSMFQYAKLGWDKGAWGPLIWQFGAAGALGGLGAMGPLKWTADALANWHDGSPNSYLWMQEHWHHAADELYFGFPALFGASLQASSTLPGTDVRNDLTSLSSFVFLERAKAAWKATGAAWDYGVANGQDPLRQPNIRDALMQAYAPRALFRLFASTEGDYIKSMSSGYPEVRDVNPLSKFLYGAGLNQVQVERQQIASRELWKDKTARDGYTQQLGIAMADAQLNGDFDQMEQINQRAMSMGLPVTSVYKSAHTRLRRGQQSDLLTQYRGQLANQYRQAWQGD